MKTEVIKEKPAFELQGSSYNGSGDPVAIFFSDLRKAKVGDKWLGRDSHNCGRDMHEESAEVVYRTGEGVAILFRCWGTTDAPDPEDWEEEPVLKWFEFC